MHWKIYHSKVHLTENVYPLVILKIQKFGKFKRKFYFIYVEILLKIFIFILSNLSLYAAQKMKFSIKDFFSKWTKSAGNCGLVVFTEEIFNWKFHFLCSEDCIWKACLQENAEKIVIWKLCLYCIRDKMPVNKKLIWRM